MTEVNDKFTLNEVEKLNLNILIKKSFEAALSRNEAILNKKEKVSILQSVTKKKANLQRNYGILLKAENTKQKNIVKLKKKYFESKKIAVIAANAASKALCNTLKAYKVSLKAADKILKVAEDASNNAYHDVIKEIKAEADVFAKASEKAKKADDVYIATARYSKETDAALKAAKLEVKIAVAEAETLEDKMRTLNKEEEKSKQEIQTLKQEYRIIGEKIIILKQEVQTAEENVKKVINIMIRKRYC